MVDGSAAVTVAAAAAAAMIDRHLAAAAAAVAGVYGEGVSSSGSCYSPLSVAAAAMIV